MFLSVRQQQKRITLLEWNSPFLSVSTIFVREATQKSDITGMALTIFVRVATKKSDIAGMIPTIFIHGATKTKVTPLKNATKFFSPGKKTL